MEPINVLSLFDGISCGQIALERVNIKVANYYASEVDKNCINITQHNYPNTKQLGDIKNVLASNLPKIDLLIGNKLNFEDLRSKLFFEFLRLKGECNPKYWLLENVVMKKEWSDIITGYLGVEPILINSSLVSAQNRERLYWTNISGISQPGDLNIDLIDILEKDSELGEDIAKNCINKAVILGRRLNDGGNREDMNRNIKMVQCLEVKKTNTNKCNCLSTVAKDNILTSLSVGRYIDPYKNKLPFRFHTVKECCRLQTVPDNYFNNGTSESQIRKMLGNGWTVDVIVHLLKNIWKS